MISEGKIIGESGHNNQRKPHEGEEIDLSRQIAKIGPWAINSGVECYLHTVEVTGSNPVSPTDLTRDANLIWPFLFL